MQRKKRNRHKITAILAAILIAGITFQPNVTTSSSVITVPDDYPTIQEAINVAHEEDTIFVKAGQYNESIIIDKSINLIGEDKETTIIDGNYNMTVILVQADHVNITSFTIQNSRTNIVAISSLIAGSAAGGIAVLNSSSNIITNNTMQGCVAGVAICKGSGNNVVRDNEVIRGDLLGTGFTAFGICDRYGVGDNTISNNNMSGVSTGIFVSATGVNGEIINGNRIIEGAYGIWLHESTDNALENNTISEFETGIELDFSGNNILRRNSLYNNTYSFGVTGLVFSDYINDIDISNTIDGKPIYYLINQTDLDINPRTWPKIGFLGLINSKNVRIWRLSLAGNIQGLLLAQTSVSEIAECYFTNNRYGIYLWNCSGNTIMGNTVTSSSYAGIEMIECEGNIIRGNTLLENGEGIYMEDSKDNTFHRNNFFDNYVQIISGDHLTNTWDDRNSFPGPFPCPICGEPRPVGNYWSDYTGLDDGLHTQAHNCPGDGIGDTGLPCQEVDYYPLMRPWVPVFGDLDYNGIVNILDISKAARNFGKISP